MTSVLGLLAIAFLALALREQRLTIALLKRKISALEEQNRVLRGLRNA